MQQTCNLKTVKPFQNREHSTIDSKNIHPSSTNVLSCHSKFTSKEWNPEPLKFLKIFDSEKWTNLVKIQLLLFFLLQFGNCVFVKQKITKNISNRHSPPTHPTEKRLIRPTKSNQWVCFLNPFVTKHFLVHSLKLT